MKAIIDLNTIDNLFEGGGASRPASKNGFLEAGLVLEEDVMPGVSITDYKNTAHSDHIDQGGVDAHGDHGDQ